jgi:hypothetical protein
MADIFMGSTELVMHRLGRMQKRHEHTFTNIHEWKDVLFILLLAAFRYQFNMVLMVLVYTYTAIERQSNGASIHRHSCELVAADAEGIYTNFICM